MVQVLMPPEFEYLSSLFLPDIARARLVGKIASNVTNFDPGAEGKTAREQTQNLDGEVLVVGVDSDGSSASILEAAVCEAGVKQVSKLIVSDQGEDVLKTIGIKDEGKSPLENSPCFMIQEKEKNEGAFVEKNNYLIRKVRGKAGSIPNWVKKIFLIRWDDQVDHWEENTIYAFSFFSPDELNPSWEKACAKIIEAVGPDCFRLAHLNPKPCSTSDWGGAPWAGKYGLENRGFTQFLRELTKKHLPLQAGLLEVVIGYYQLGVDPFEEIYNSNALIDRNQELIVNIVP